MRLAWADGTDAVLVVNVEGELRAFQGTCSHEYFELDRGFLTRGTLTCALHLSRFDLASGEALDPPADLPLARYPVVLEGGRILIEAPDGPLPEAEIHARIVEQLGVYSDADLEPLRVAASLGRREFREAFALATSARSSSAHPRRRRLFV